MTFGEVLRTLRRETGTSQRDLASKIGLDYSYISKLENDRLPSPSAEAKIATLQKQIEAYRELSSSLAFSER